MRIYIHRHADVAMAQQFLYNFRMNPHTEQNSGSTMPQIMKAQSEVSQLLLRRGSIWTNCT
jgi:hypothetical protein